MDKYIDKLIDTRWFMKVVALLIALLLFDSVYDTNNDNRSINVPGDDGSAVIENVPLTAYYDTDNLVVSGLPETVAVTLDGPRSHLENAKAQRNFEVFVDLSDAEIGRQEVEVGIKDLSDKLEYIIDPSTVDVTIDEKVTEEFNVEAEFNNSLLEEGYKAEAALAEPSTVKITGAKNVIESIAYVKATVNTKGSITESFTETAAINVLDRNMNKLDVDVNPGEVEVSVDVKRLSKTVPIDIVETGSLPSGVELDSLKLSQTEATIFAPENVLNDVKTVRVEVDLSKLDKDQEIKLPVIISDGITSVDPKEVTVNANVTVKEQEAPEDSSSEEEESQVQEQEQEQAANEQTVNRTYSGMPITITGLDDQYDVTFQSPDEGETSLKVSGNEKDMNSLSKGDFTLSIDVSGLDPGEHEVNIQLDAPPGVESQLESETATINITEKE
ncbi:MULTISPECIES: CdaR family protein [Cytobacillus]|uniref:CdaR family protein n=1 Tax=Cytobacillus TaxID=2675230 RepID=UPI00203E8304|nr:CdaR family protein [Cytobacillus kochii]MCM3325016.1 CdaR family protein [Cytobacillus kochii]MCM3347393.1 CdaR family protein [Cytobacillus kochii]MDM5205614.1 CdaR family protein [Cytobacillus kochii]